MSLEGKLREEYGEEINQVDDIEELNIDGLITTAKLTNEDKNYLEKFKSLTQISANGIGLASLENFPEIAGLKEIALEDNKISGSLAPLQKFKELTTLTLNANPINDFQVLEPLKILPNLVKLDLMDCPLYTKENYRETILKMFPKLKDLDGLDREGKDIEIEEQDDSEEEEEAEEEDEEESEGKAEESEDEDDDEEDGDEIVQPKKRASAVKPGKGDSENEDSEEEESEEEIAPPKKGKKNQFI
eukprot:TRINITY_DN15382_c0_g1_i1.p1 TRINITY_DN15382_c0_g1~~TRINITY_DN15382_c0_g1_i1.p1  ORF type:complete len:245 (-),score=83.19 TRINITY_DN15382_c0_g1_i1:32-766(-)